MTSFASDLAPPANALEFRETKLHKTPAFLYFEREACLIELGSLFLQGIVGASLSFFTNSFVCANVAERVNYGGNVGTIGISERTSSGT